MPTERSIVYQPLSHIYGLGLVLTGLYSGITTLIMPKFDLESFISLIAEFKVRYRYIHDCTYRIYTYNAPYIVCFPYLQVDMIHVVPPIMVQLASSDVTRGYDLSCLRSLSSGAAPLSRELEENVMRMLGGHCHIRQSKYIYTYWYMFMKYIFTFD